MNKWVKRLLPASQIGGGLVGLSMVTQVLRHVEQTTGSLIVHMAFCAVFAFGIAAGILLITKPRLGLYLSLIFQFIQIPILTTSAVAYRMFSGATFHAYVGQEKFGTYLHFGAGYSFWLKPADSWMVGINFVALFFFIYLIRQLWLPAPVVQDSQIEEPQCAPAEVEGRLNWRTS